MIRDAKFSQPGMRAWLVRSWDRELPRGAFIGANPGPADANIDDATARKYVGFGQRWGWGSYIGFNLFQCVAPDIDELIARILRGERANPDSPDSWIERGLASVKVACLAWGNTPNPIASTWTARAGAIVRLLTKWNIPMIAAARTKAGSPAHLSRLPYTEVPHKVDLRR